MFSPGRGSAQARHEPSTLLGNSFAARTSTGSRARLDGAARRGAGAGCTMSSVRLSRTGRVTSITVETAAPGVQHLASSVSSLLDALVEADRTPDTESILLMSDIDSFGLEMPMTLPAEPPVQTPGWRLVYRLLDIEKPLVVVV